MNISSGEVIFEIGYLLSLVVIGLSFLVFMLAMMVDEINKKKAIVMYVLSIILLLAGGFYYYTVGQWQKLHCGPSVNKLNYFLYIYRQPPAVQQVVPFPPESPNQ